MLDLNNPTTYKHLDPKDVFGSTELFLKQCKQIWETSKDLKLPKECSQIKNVVISGMGGSAYGGYVVLSLFKDILAVPVVVNNDYSLPEFVDENSLVVLSSYSGSTEETLSSGIDALKRNAKIVGLTSGGKLSEFLKENKLPVLEFFPKYNPSDQPRLGTGYMVLGIVAILKKTNCFSIKESLIDEEFLSAVNIEVSENQDYLKIKAEEIAKKIYGHIPLIFTADFLEGNSHILRNQLNETAKTFSSFHAIPELNHHLMEGLKNPTERKLFTLFLESHYFSPNIQTRIILTKEVLDKNNVLHTSFTPKETTKTAQMLSVLWFGAYLSFYLAILYNQDPSVIPWVDYFKEQLHPVK